MALAHSYNSVLHCKVLLIAQSAGCRCLSLGTAEVYDANHKRADGLMVVEAQTRKIAISCFSLIRIWARRDPDGLSNQPSLNAQNRVGVTDQFVQSVRCRRAHYITIPSAESGPWCNKNMLYLKQYQGDSTATLPSYLDQNLPGVICLADFPGRILGNIS